MRLFYRSALVVGLAVVMASCGKSSTSPTESGTSNPANGAAIDIPASDVYGLTNFNPGQVSVVVGSSVSFQNSDGIEHHPTADDGSWNIDLMSGAGGSEKFQTPGTYTFHCAIHPNMTGTVTVK
jgi:plastocyanin